MPVLIGIGVVILIGLVGYIVYLIIRMYLVKKADKVAKDIIKKYKKKAVITGVATLGICTVVSIGLIGLAFIKLNIGGYKDAAMIISLQQMIKNREEIEDAFRPEEDSGKVDWGWIEIEDPDISLNGDIDDIENNDNNPIPDGDGDTDDNENSPIGPGPSSGGNTNIGGSSYIDVLRRCFVSASNSYNNRVKPEHCFGVMYRESGNKIFNILSSNSNIDLMTQLVPLNPVCGWDVSNWTGFCNWAENKYSHFVGGKIDSKKNDTGNPATDKINTSMEIYTKMQADYNSKHRGGSPGHAIGIGQFEVPYVYGIMLDLYNSGALAGKRGVGENVIKDSQLGFIRPNPCYVPDAVQNIVRLHSQNVSTSDFNAVVSGTNYKQLSKDNQDFVYFCYSGIKYGRGNNKPEDKEFIHDLVQSIYGKQQYDNGFKADSALVGTGAINNNFKFTGSRETWTPIILKYIGLKNHYDDKDKRMFGLYAASLGKAAWVKADGTSSNIPNGDNGNKPNGDKPNGDNGNKPNGDKPNGDNGNKPNGDKGTGSIGDKYCSGTKFMQSKFSEYGKLKLKDGKTSMSQAGCGVYSLAYSISVLTGKEVTPGDVLNKAKTMDNVILSNCLAYQDIEPIANSYGLKVRVVSLSNRTSNEVEKIVKDELAQGNVAMACWRDDLLGESNKGKFPWYTGSGHFMVIRGYRTLQSKDGEIKYQFRPYTSIAGKSKSREKTCMEGWLEMDIIQKYVTPRAKQLYIISK